MGLSRYADYFFKNLSLTLNFIIKGMSTKDISKAATNCTTVAAINYRDTRISCFDQQLLFICLKVFVISVTNKTVSRQNIGAVHKKYVYLINLFV